MQIMATPFNSWFGKTILFPRVVSPAITEGQGDEVISERILSFHWNEKTSNWDEKYLLAGPNGWGREGPDYVKDTAIIPYV